MTTQEKARLIIQDIVSEKGNNPVRIFKNIAKKEYTQTPGCQGSQTDRYKDF